MGKHRKNRQYRRAAIAAVAVGAVGIPSAAMACAHWPDSGRNDERVAQHRTAAPKWSYAAEGRHTAGSARPSADVPDASRTPATTATPSPTAPASASATAPATKTRTAPAPTRTAPAHRAKTTATTAPAPSRTSAASHPRPAASAGTAQASNPAAATPAATGTPRSAATASGDIERVVELVNAERGKVGCSPLTLNTELTEAAQAHSEDMAAHRTMSHTGSDGSSPGERITRAGYAWSSYGENVAYGYATPEQVMAGWMNSPGHRANILDCDFKEIGVGHAQPGDYWTQDFGASR
ncbi:CAP domain-containing protein [Streptomyces mexicanus]